MLSVFYLFIPGFLNKNNVEITLCTRNDTFQLIQRREMVEKGLTIPSFFFYFFAILNSFFTAVSATVIRQFSELCPRFGTSVQRDSLDTPADIVPECNRKHCLASHENAGRTDQKYPYATKEEIEIKVAWR